MADTVKGAGSTSPRRLPASAFVTGATGFIGHRLTAALLEAGCEVSALVLPAELSQLPASVRAFAGDITDAGAVADALARARPELVFHLAAIGITNPGLPMAEACRINVGGLIHLIEGVRSVDTVSRVVIAGTSYEYGARRSDDGLDPFNPYSASKVAAWAFARAAYNAWSVPIVFVRPFQVYGPGQRARALIPATMTTALRGEDFRMTKGEQQRDFVFVRDVVQGFLAAARAPEIEGRALDLGTGELHTVTHVVTRIWDMAEAPGRILVGALPYRAGEVPAIPANVQRTRLLTGWEAVTDLDQGLSLTIDALREEIVDVE